jgi:hypothetical protein
MSEYLVCEHISVSRKQTWENCQQAYKYRYHLKIIPDVPQQPYFTYGKLVHKIAEVYVQEQGKKPIEEITSECLNGTIEIEKNLPPPILNADYKKKLPDHVRHIKTLTDRIGFDGILEHPFKFDLDPPNEHFVVGFIDRLIIRGDKFFILDYKTTKKGMWRKNSNTIRKDLQLRACARVVQKEFGAKAENIKAALYYLEGAELVATKFNDHMLLTAEQELHDAYKQIRSTNPDDVRGRVGDQCRRCDYRKVCSWYSLT